MPLLIEILNVVLPVFLVVGLGYALGRRGLIDEATNARLSRLVFYVAAPLLLFRSAAVTPLSRAMDATAMLAIAGVTVFVAMTTYLAACRSAPSRRGVIAQGAHRSNMVFVGLPLVENAFGSTVLGPAAVLIGFMVPVFNVLAVLVLSLPHHNEEDGLGSMWARAALEILRNPLILGTLAGVLVSVLGLPVPVAADRSLELVSRVAMPLALLSLGAGLDPHRIRSEVVPTAVVALIKLVIFPALLYAALGALGVGGLDRQFAVLLLACPNAVVSHIMAREMKGDERLAAALVMGTTLASLLTLSAWVAFFHLQGVA